VALIVLNDQDAPQTFAVTTGGRSFTATLPAGALATYVW
jgi:glucosylceramidase